MQQSQMVTTFCINCSDYPSTKIQLHAFINGQFFNNFYRFLVTNSNQSVLFHMICSCGDLIKEKHTFSSKKLLFISIHSTSLTKTVDKNSQLVVGERF